MLLNASSARAQAPTTWEFSLVPCKQKAERGCCHELRALRLASLAARPCRSRQHRWHPDEEG